MPKKSAPSYLRHASGQAFARVNGKNLYFGKYGSPESLAKYDDFKREWLLQHGDVRKYRLTVDELAIFYIGHAEQYYRKNGAPTSEVWCIRAALRFAVQTLGACRVRDFGPAKLKQVRQAMIDHGLARESINKNIDRIRRMVRWGVENEKVPPEVLAALVAVRGLGKGRSNARETEPVKPVPIDRVEAIQPYVKPLVWAMIQLQLFTGARPGEVIIMRGCDLDMTGEVWVYVPASHKTEHHGRGRTIFIGPKAQAVIRPFLKAGPQAYLFSPRDVCKVRRGGTRQPGARYNRNAYRNAVLRACERAFAMPKELRGIPRGLTKKEKELPPAEQSQILAEREKLRAKARAWRHENCWHPHQLRHNAGTTVRAAADLDAARTVMGQGSLAVAEIYAEKDLETARMVIAKIG